AWRSRGGSRRGPAGGRPDARTTGRRRSELAELVRPRRLADRVPFPRPRHPALRGGSAAFALDPRAGRPRGNQGCRGRPALGRIALLVAIRRAGGPDTVLAFGGVLREPFERL